MNKGISTSNNNPGGPFAGFFRGLFEVKVAKQQSETVKSESEQKKLIIQIAYGKIELSRNNYFDILSGLGHDQLVDLRKKLVENLKNAHILSPVLPIIENSLMFLDTKNPGASNIVSFSSGLDQRVLNDLSRADTFEGFIRVCQTYLDNKSLDKKNKVKLKSLLMWVGNGGGSNDIYSKMKESDNLNRFFEGKSNNPYFYLNQEQTSQGSKPVVSPVEGLPPGQSTDECESPLKDGLTIDPETIALRDEFSNLFYTHFLKELLSKTQNKGKRNTDQLVSLLKNQIYGNLISDRMISGQITSLDITNDRLIAIFPILAKNKNILRLLKTFFSKLPEFFFKNRFYFFKLSSEELKNFIDSSLGV